MDKKSQLINLIPIQSFALREAVTDKEAKSLFYLWNHKTADMYGNIIIPDDVDHFTVAALVNKGLIQKPALHNLSADKAVQITDRGKELIKNIILYSERSAFDKMSDTRSLDRLTCNPIAKIASKTTHPQNINWLQKACK